MSLGGEYTCLEILGIRTASEHIFVMVRLYDDTVTSAQPLCYLAGKMPDVSSDAYFEGVGSVCVFDAVTETRTRVVTNAKGRDAYPVLVNALPLRKTDSARDIYAAH